MGWDTPDVYYSPERFGLEIVDSIEWDNEAWQFNMTCVWRDGEGNFFMADDSGCSCPSPFDRFNSIEELEKVTKFEAAAALQAKAEAQKPTGEKYDYNTQENYDRVSGEVVDAISKIMA